MAKSVLELAVGTGQWDGGLKKAKSALDSFVSAQGGIQQALEKDSENVKKFVQMMGNMESSAKTVKGQMNDYKSAIEQLTLQYKDLTDAQKKNIGQDYLKSIDQLKTKFKEATNTAGELKNELNGTGGFMDALTSKLTVNIDAMKLFEVGLKAGSAALGVAKDAFFASEETVDEWGRTMASAQSLYEGFLTALNTGDISGYLNNISQIVAAAREAYNELDTLQTMQTIQAPAKSAKETEINRMRMMLMTGKYIAPSDGRAAAMFNGRRMQTGDTLTPGQLRGIEKQITNATKDIVTITEREVKQAGKHIDAYYNKLAKENGIALADFRKGTSSWDEFTKRVRGAEEYRKFESEHTYTRQAYNAQIGEYETQYYRDNVANPYTQYRGWDVFRVDKMGENSYNDLVGYIKQRDQQSNQLYSLLGQTFRTTNRLEGITPRNLLKGAGGSGNGGNGPAAKEVTSMLKIDELGNITISTTESMKQLQTQLRDYQQKLSTATNAFDQYSAQQGIEQTQKKIDAQPMALSLGWDTENVVQLQDNLDTLLEDMRSKIKANPLKVEVDTKGGGLEELDNDAKVNMKAWGAAASAVQNLGNALQSLEDPSAKIAGIVGQAVANIALGFAQATASPATGAAGVFGWIAAATAGLATMVATITQIKSVTKGGFAEGGIVPGNSFSGDNLHINDYGINSGELILNRSQQNNIAAQLQGNNLENLSLTSRISGRDLIIAINANQTSINGGKLSFTS